MPALRHQAGLSLATTELPWNTTIIPLTGSDLCSSREHITDGRRYHEQMWNCSYLKPISSSAGKHLVDAQHMEGVHTHTQVKGILSSILGHVLVSSNASCLKCLTADLLLLPTA